MTSWLTNLADWAVRVWIAGGVLIVAGLVLAVWAIRGDRARGRRRCPKCWYDLRGTPGLRCSECGYVAKTERQLGGSRRRWRWVALACTVQSAGIALALWPKIQKDGWPSLLPTWALLVLVPDEPGAATYPVVWIQAGAGSAPKIKTHYSIPSELFRRDAAGSLSDRQWAYVVKHKGVIRTRARWPEKVPLAVSLNCPGWLEGCAIRFRVTPTSDEGPKPGMLYPAPCITHGARMRRPRLVGQFHAGTREVLFDCAVERRENAWYEEQDLRQLWYGPIHLGVKLVETIDEAITPERDPEVTNAMRQALSLSVGPLPAHCSYPCEDAELVVRLDRSKNPRLAEIAFGLAVDLLYEDRVVQTVRFSPSIHDWETDPLSENRDLFIFDKARPFREEDGFSNWMLRVRGDAEMALYDWDKPKYWAGEFTVPLSEVLVRE